MDGFTEMFKVGEEMQKKEEKMKISTEGKDGPLKIEIKDIDLEKKGDRLTISNCFKKMLEVGKKGDEIILVINPK